MSRAAGYKLIHPFCARQAGFAAAIRHGGDGRGRYDDVCALCWRPGTLALVGPLSRTRVVRASARRRKEKLPDRPVTFETRPAR